MFGATIGTLQVQICAGSTCTTAWNRTGQQHTSLTDPWTLASINLPASTTSVRWVATRGTSFTGDISIDTILIAPGPVPLTPSPTAAPPCPPASPNAPFTVLVSSPVQTCAGGGGPTSAAQGTCYTTTSGTCFTDGPGNHGNSEGCTIMVNTPTTLTVSGTLSLQRNLDYFTVGTSTARLDTTTELNGLAIAPQTPIFWRSSASVTNAGYTICVSVPHYLPTQVSGEFLLRTVCVAGRVYNPCFNLLLRFQLTNNRRRSVLVWYVQIESSECPFQTFFTELCILTRALSSKVDHRSGWVNDIVRDGSVKRPGGNIR